MVVLTSAWDWIMACHFLTILEHSLSQVWSMPWKLVRQFLPWTSSVISLDFLNATSLFCRSARLTLKTRPLRPSDAILIPWVFLTSVFPMFHILNIAGTFTSYQSFIENGLTAFFLATFLPLFVSTCSCPLPWCCSEGQKGYLLIFLKIGKIFNSWLTC